MFQRPRSSGATSPADSHDDDAPEDGAPAFQWDFEAGSRPRASSEFDAQTSQARTDPPGAGKLDARRTAAIHQALERGLERWWAYGELPSAALVIDGLRLLESGGRLPDNSRALLLRAALTAGRGWQTALRHRGDDELSALVAAEVLASNLEPTLEAALIAWLTDPRQRLQTWRDQLVLALRQLGRESNGAVRGRALALAATIEAARQAAVDEAPVDAVPRRPNLPARRAILLLLMVVLIAYLIWERMPGAPPGMVEIQAGVYTLATETPAGQVLRQVQLASFWIDQTEVRNRDYRRCVDQGHCSKPFTNASATRADYFVNPAFDDYPVVQVNQAAAASYCAWQGKRLPTADEWQVAAGVDPISGQQYTYPWGAEFAEQLANSAGSQAGDTLPVGTFRPAGDSPSGLADMAGNVAEWTATQGGDDDRVVVKGGGFVGDGAALRVGAELRLDVDEALPWLGFRCARSPASR